MTNPEAAWLAAMIDGEGSVVRRPYGYTVKITNNATCLLEEARRITGFGSITADRDAFQWRVGAKAEVSAILTRILPWLILKRAKAVSALGELHGDCRVRRVCHGRLRRDALVSLADEAPVREGHRRGGRHPQCRGLGDRRGTGNAHGFRGGGG